MSLNDIRRELARRGPDKLIATLLELRAHVDHLRYQLLSASLPEGVGWTLDKVEASLGNVETMLVNMQSSCVRLPRADRASSEAWELPVVTEARSLLADATPADRDHRFFRIRFEVDPSGKTWKWKLREHVLDTGIPVRCV